MLCSSARSLMGGVEERSKVEHAPAMVKAQWKAGRVAQSASMRATAWCECTVWPRPCPNVPAALEAACLDGELGRQLVGRAHGTALAAPEPPVCVQHGAVLMGAGGCYALPAGIWQVASKHPMGDAARPRASTCSARTASIQCKASCHSLAVAAPRVAGWCGYHHLGGWVCARRSCLLTERTSHHHITHSKWLPFAHVCCS